MPGCCNCCCNASQAAAELTPELSELSSDSGDPCGIRTRDLYLERVASWAARRTGHRRANAAARGDECAQEYTRSALRITKRIALRAAETLQVLLSTTPA